MALETRLPAIFDDRVGMLTEPFNVRIALIVVALVAYTFVIDGIARTVMAVRTDQTVFKTFLGMIPDEIGWVRDLDTVASIAKLIGHMTCIALVDSGYRRHVYELAMWDTDQSRDDLGLFGMELIDVLVPSGLGLGGATGFLTRKFCMPARITTHRVKALLEVTRRLEFELR